MMEWSDPSTQDSEQEKPVPPYTRVIAVKDFKAEHPHDLPFSKGDRLCILEPCNVIFWYLAEDRWGKRGVIPINFVKVEEVSAALPSLPRPPTSTTDTRAPSHPPPLPPKPSSSNPPSPALPPKPASRTIPRSVKSLHSPLTRTSSAEKESSASHHPSHPPYHPKHTLNPHPSSPHLSRAHTSHPSHTHTPQSSHTHPLSPPILPKPHKDKLVPSSTSSGATPPHVTTPIKQATPPGGTSKKAPYDQIPDRPPTTSHPPPPHPPSSHPPPSSAAPPSPSASAQPVRDIDHRPPAPLPPEAFNRKKEPPVLPPPGKYRTMMDFIQKSGWFTPSVEGIICNKAMLQMPVFQTMKAGVYLFQHKYDDSKKYVGKSYNLYTDLIQLFHRLFEKPEEKLSPIELELKYRTPDADKWYIRIYPVMNPDLLNLEETKIMVKFRTVQPEGLNTELVFHSREHWYDFAAWYREFLQRNSRKKPPAEVHNE